MGVQMSDSSGTDSMPGQMSAEEWETRIDLAACYQLVDLYGWTDFTATHISAYVPGSNGHFLLNPMGHLFGEMAASMLVKVDLDGNILDKTDSRVNQAGFTIHSAIHMSSQAMRCVLHTHTPAGNAIAMQKEGLLPSSQKAMLIEPFVRYHDYEGPSRDLSERERIAASLGDSRILILRNHGLLTVGETIGEAFGWMHLIETACQYQVAGLSGNRELHSVSAETRAHVNEQGRQILGQEGLVSAPSAWRALIRQLERERGTSYRE